MISILVSCKTIEMPKRKASNQTGMIAVKTDGTYQKRGDRKRGYMSKVAVITLTDAKSGKFLDFRVLTKHCHVCTQKKSTLPEEEFNDWFTIHQESCSARFVGFAHEKIYKKVIIKF